MGNRFKTRPEYPKLEIVVCFLSQMTEQFLRTPLGLLEPKTAPNLVYIIFFSKKVRCLRRHRTVNQD